MDKSIIEKVKSLLRKAQDNRGNVHECELAMKMAQRLIIKHKINQALLNESETIDISACERLVSYYKSLVEVRYINLVLIRFFEARIILADYPDAKIISTEENIDFAVYVYDFLKTAIKACFKRYLKGNKRANRAAFAKGFIYGLYDVLYEECEKVKAETGQDYQKYEIVLASGKKVVEKYIAENFVLVKKKSPKVSSRANASYGAGYVRGVACKINKPIA